MCILDLFFDSLTNAERLQIIWKSTKRLIVTDPKGVFDGVSLLVSVLVEHCFKLITCVISYNNLLDDKLGTS